MKPLSERQWWWFIRAALLLLAAVELYVLVEGCS